MFNSDVSLLGREWSLRSGTWVRGEAGTDAGIPPLVREIARRRGVEDVAAFLEPTLRNAMPDPSSVRSMDAATSLVADTLEAGRRIAVLGDYDVDGATSTAILLRWLRAAGSPDPLFHIPQRLTEGYGPNIPAIERLRAEGADLLVIADSGTGAIEQVARARQIGMDVLVLDHHTPNEDGSLPDAIVINPKIPSNGPDLSYLCTAGLAFLFLVGLAREARKRGRFGKGIDEPRLADLLGLVALGTVADMVALEGLNRAYVSVGLGAMGRIPGLVALRDQLNQGCQPGKEVGWTVRACGFSYGPCINAAGRISDTRLGTRLLVSDDMDEAGAIAADLVDLNLERRALQEATVKEGVATVTDPGPQDAVLVLHDEKWHPGVVGLGAGKIKDRFDRSAVFIGAGGKGSGRSVAGFDIGKAFLRAVDAGLLLKGGGHSAAGGLTIDPARIAEFTAFMQKQSRGIARPPTKVDLVLHPDDIDIRKVEEFEALAPFGMGNVRPRVAFVGGVVDQTRVMAGKHVKAVLCGIDRSVEAMVFNGVGTPLGDALLASAGHMVDVLGEPRLNHFNGRTVVQVVVEDIMVGGAVSDVAQAAA